MDDELQCLRALSDRTRFSIVVMLSRHDLCAGAISRRLGITEAAVSQHIKVLRDAGLVISEKYGYYMHYRVDDRRLAEMSDFIMGMTRVERRPCDPEAEGCTAKKVSSCPSEKGRGTCPKLGTGESPCFGCRMFMALSSEQKGTR